MPPRVKITKDDIIKTAVELVRENGAESLNARAIALALDCSTQPIFSNFKTMEELFEATIVSAYEIYLAMSEVIFMAQCEGAGAGRIAQLEEIIARALGIHWHEYDRPGDFQW